MERQGLTKNNQRDGQKAIQPATKPASATRASVHPLLQLQQTIGNRAVQQLAQFCPVFPSRCPFGGACHTCPARVQAKLKVNQPGDMYEQEADRVAEQMMRMPEPVPSPLSTGASPAFQRKCPECASGQGLCPRCAEEEKMMQRKPLSAQITPLIQRQETEEQEEEEELQAKEVSGKTPAVSPSVESHINSMRDGDQPMPESVRAFFEPRFGSDFSQVRMHTDARAAESARAVNALAYTIGQDIVFGAGQYELGTANGRELLAHELTHVVQQYDKKSQALEIQRKVVVNPDAAAADDILSQIRFLCKDANFDRSGQTIITDQSSIASKSCECLTDVVGDPSRTYTIDVKGVVGSTQVENDGTSATVPMPSFFPQTSPGQNPTITLPSAGSDPEFGIFLTNGSANWRPRWRVLGHELCGHARLNQHIGGPKGKRPGHDTTIDTENEIAAGHGEPERGHFGDVRQGESFHNIVGDRNKIVFWLTDGLHYETP